MLNLMQMHGVTPLPTENEIIQWCQNDGKPATDWDTKGIVGDDEIQRYYNLVLQRYGLGLSHCGGELTRAEAKQKLLAGKTLVFGGKVINKDGSETGHHVCLRMRPDGQVEIRDPYKGKVYVRSLDEAMRWADWSSSLDSGKSGKVWEVTP